MKSWVDEDQFEKEQGDCKPRRAAYTKYVRTGGLTKRRSQFFKFSEYTMIYISIGSNLGNRLLNIKKALNLLKSCGFILLKQSIILKHKLFYHLMQIKLGISHI